MARAGVRRRWTVAVAVAVAIVAALAWVLVFSPGTLDARLERAGWVGAVIATLAFAVYAVRWVWLWQAQRPLKELAGPQGFLGAAPQLEPRFVDRPDLVAATVAALRVGRRAGGRVGGVAAPGAVALVGIGGTGKSTLAAAVCRNRRLRRRFRQATWLEAGPGTDPVGLLTELARRLGMTDPSYSTLVQARDALAAQLAGRRLLIVLDNVWTRQPLDAFMGLAPGCRVLFTTRMKDLATTVAATPVEVDELTQEQALAVLARWTGRPADQLPPEARRLCTRLGNLALGVAMAGAMAARGRAFTDIADLVDHDLARIGGDFAPGYAYATLRAAIDVGIEDLPEQRQRDHYEQLAAFTGRGPFPRSAAAALWHRLPDDQVAELLAELIGRSLLTVAGDGWYVAHDLQYDTLTQRLGQAGVQAAHQALIDGWRARYRHGWAQAATGDRYLAAHLTRHLHQAGHHDELADLLSQTAWMHTRINHSSLPDLIGDYTHAPDPRAHAIRRALMQSAPALTTPPRPGGRADPTGRDAARDPGRATGRTPAGPPRPAHRRLGPHHHPPPPPRPGWPPSPPAS